MKSILRAIPALVLFASSVGVVGAQQKVNGLEEGAWAIDAQVPWGGSNEFGLWRMTSDQNRLGLTVRSELTFVDTGAGDSRTISVGLGPALRHYLRRDGRVVPFLDARIGATYSQRRLEPALGPGSQEYRTVGGELSLGGGLEWFPVREVSLSLHTGIESSYGRRRTTTSLIPGLEFNSTVSQFSLATFTGGLAFALYLPPQRDREERGNGRRRR